MRNINEKIYHDVSKNDGVFQISENIFVEYNLFEINNFSKRKRTITPKLATKKLLQDFADKN